MGESQRGPQHTTEGAKVQYTWQNEIDHLEFESTDKLWKKLSDEHKPVRKVMDQNETFAFLLKVNIFEGKFFEG